MKKRLPMKEDRFSAEDKLAEVRREIRYRERVYPRLIQAERLSPAQADRQLDIMRAIESDLERLAAKERLI